jgi:hypothetical protein
MGGSREGSRGLEAEGRRERKRRRGKRKRRKGKRKKEK